MKSGWITAGIAAAILVPGLAACGGGSSGPGSSGGGSSSGASAAPPEQAAASATPDSAGGSGASGASGASGGSGGSGSLTPPGAQLGFGQAATVAWVPEATGSGAQRGVRLQITVESIEKGTMADFANVQLNGAERKSTPYYVKLRIKALGSKPASGTDNDPAITLDAIDDRGQQQQSVTFFGTFQRCNDNTPPKPFVNGKSYDSCLAYLMPGGGSIQKVQWADGPAAANQVTPYFDHPIVWGS